jgi:hypothetical protein
MPRLIVELADTGDADIILLRITKLILEGFKSGFDPVWRLEDDLEE